MIRSLPARHLIGAVLAILLLVLLIHNSSGWEYVGSCHCWRHHATVTHSHIHRGHK
jgi:hypothetical protein